MADRAEKAEVEVLASAPPIRLVAQWEPGGAPGWLDLVLFSGTRLARVWASTHDNGPYGKEKLWYASQLSESGNRPIANGCRTREAAVVAVLQHFGVK